MIVSRRNFTDWRGCSAVRPEWPSGIRAGCVACEGNSCHLRLCARHRRGHSGALFRRETAQVTRKQPMIVENKPGAGTSIASEYTVRSKPGGYALFINPGNGLARLSLPLQEAHA